MYTHVHTRAHTSKSVHAITIITLEITIIVHAHTKIIRNAILLLCLNEIRVLYWFTVMPPPPLQSTSKKKRGGGEAENAHNGDKTTLCSYFALKRRRRGGGGLNNEGGITASQYGIHHLFLSPPLDSPLHVERVHGVGPTFDGQDGGCVSARITRDVALKEVLEKLQQLKQT